MSQSALPLLCRSPLLPDESLPSLLAWLTSLNSYGSTGILKRLCLNGAQDNLDRPSKVATFERIASLAKLSWQELYAATAHRFSETLTLPGTQIESLDFSLDETIPLLAAGMAFEQLRPASAAQFCPRCLEESAYHYEFPEYLEETRYQFVRRAEVMALRNKWANGISLEDAARYLGLSQQGTLDLVGAGLLFAERGPEIDGSSHWAFSKQAVTECYSEVANGLLCYAPAGAVIDLVGATQILSAVGLDATGILKSVAIGELRGFLPGKSRGLGEVVFVEVNIRVYLEKLKEKRKWVTLKEIARRMGVTEPTISRWLQEGLLSPLIVCGSTSYFEPDVVEEFIAGHVFDEKAAEILGVGVDQVRQWTRKGQLKAVSGPGVDYYYRNLYRRKDVEGLRQKWTDGTPDAGSSGH